MDYTTIYSYPKAWQIDGRIYSFFNYKLPAAIYPRQIGYFAAAALGMLALSHAVPLVTLVPSIIRYLVIPYAVSNFLLKKKLDGKNPIRYFAGWVLLRLRHGQYLERFAFRSPRQTRERLRWYCARGARRK